jgi:diguanylate cyclase (GGDEF)-like protein
VIDDGLAAGASPAARILVIDDSATIRLVVRKALADFDVQEAADGPAGLASAFENPPDVVLLDRYLPGEDGLAILAKLLHNELTRDVPVIFLTADDDPTTLVTALEVGAHDFIRKPFLAEELLARVRGAARLKRLGDELRRVANHDPLTGLLNRRALETELRRWVSLHRRYDIGLSVLVGDLRGFKQINDRYGHAMGDQALVTVAKVLGSAVRDGDLVARWGGDEFVVLLPQTDLEAARLLAERLITMVSRHAVGDCPLRITLGVADDPTEEDGADMLHRADLDLYAQRT